MLSYQLKSNNGLKWEPNGGWLWTTHMAQLYYNPINKPNQLQIQSPRLFHFNFPLPQHKNKQQLKVTSWSTRLCWPEQKQTKLGYFVEGKELTRHQKKPPGRSEPKIHCDFLIYWIIFNSIKKLSAQISYTNLTLNSGICKLFSGSTPLKWSDPTRKSKFILKNKLNEEFAVPS